MDLVLDGVGPIYAQVVRALKEGIQAGRFPPGCRFPATRDLARDLGVSRSTVLHAYERLRMEGRIAGKVGSGSYVVGSTGGAPRRTRLPGAPQSDAARRARSLGLAMRASMPGPRPMRHAFVFNAPMLNTALPAAWSREVARAASYLPSSYPEAQGLHELRATLARHIAQARGVLCDGDDILVTTGAQQAFSLIARVLLSPGDRVVVEEPQFDGTRIAFQLQGAEIVPVDVDSEGLRVEQVPRNHVKLISVTPSHQFPTGAVLSADRRRDLLEAAGSLDAWICENDFDGEFRQEGRAISSLQSMDRDARVIYVGSFSKTLFPSLRLAYLVMPPSLREDFLGLKWAEDRGTPPLEQAALAQFLSSGLYERHLRTANRVLSERRAVLKEALSRECQDLVSVNPSHSGMHLMTWVDAIAPLEADALVRYAHREGIGLFSATRFHMAPPRRAGLLMGYSAMPKREIPGAVASFARCTREFIAERTAMGRDDP